MACIIFLSDFIQRGITPERVITPTRKKTCVKYFSMRNPYKKLQNPSMHGSWRTDACTHGCTDEQPETNMPRQLLQSWGHNERDRQKKNLFIYLTVYIWEIVAFFSRGWVLILFKRSIKSNFISLWLYTTYLLYINVTTGRAIIMINLWWLELKQHIIQKKQQHINGETNQRAT